MAEVHVRANSSELDTVTYTSSSAVSTGEVVNPGWDSKELLVALGTYAANAAGTYARKGMGRAAIVSGVTVSQGDILYWDNTNNQVTNVANSLHSYIGIADAAGTAAGGYVDFRLNENPAGAGSGLIVKRATFTAADLDTTAKNKIYVETGDIVLRVVASIGTAAGATCVLNVGTDATVDGTTADADALLAGANVETVGNYSSDNATYTGVDLEGSPFTVQGAGYITITSSTDQSAATGAGSIYVEILRPGA